MKKISRLALLLLTVFCLASCQLELPRLTSPALLPSSQPQTSQKAPENMAQATELAEKTAGLTLDLAASTTELDALLADLIRTGLAEKKRNINLEEALAGYAIRVAEVEELIEHIHKLYSRIYLDSPQYFYLNGSLQVHYSVSQNDEAEGFQLEPLYWPEFAGLSSSQLDQVLARVEARVLQVAGSIRSQTSQPRQQLVLLHDWLVQNLAYDEAADQNKNHAASALLDGRTLCQGYAQSFALIGRALGFKVLLVCGSSGDMGHVWNLVELGGRTYHVDVTHDDPTPDAGPDGPVRHIHFCRSDAVMSQTHSWQRQDYPACPEDGAFYYLDAGLYVNDRAGLEAALKKFLNTLLPNSCQLELLLGPGLGLDQEQLEALLLAGIKQELAGRNVLYRVKLEKGIALFQVCEQD